jgi:hypothetical protein
MKFSILLTLMLAVSCSGGGGGGGSKTPEKVDEVMNVVFDSINSSSVLLNEQVVVSGTCEGTANNVPFLVVVGGVEKEAICSDGEFEVTYEVGEIPVGSVTVSATNKNSSEPVKGLAPFDVVQTPCNGNQVFDGSSSCSDNPITSPESTLTGGQVVGSDTFITSPDMTFSLGSSGQVRTAFVFGSPSDCANFRTNNCHDDSSALACSGITFEEIDVVGKTEFDYSIPSPTSGSNYSISILLANGSQSVSCIDQVVVLDTSAPDVAVAMDNSLTRDITKSPEVSLNGGVATTDAGGSGLSLLEVAISSDGVNPDIKAFYSIALSSTSVEADLSGLTISSATDYYIIIRATDNAGNVTTTVSNPWRYTICNTYQEELTAGVCTDMAIADADVIVNTPSNLIDDVHYLSTNSINFLSGSTKNAQHVAIFNSSTECSAYVSENCHLTVAAQTGSCTAHVREEAAIWSDKTLSISPFNTEIGFTFLYMNGTRTSSCITKTVFLNDVDLVNSSTDPLYAVQALDNIIEPNYDSAVSTVTQAIRPKAGTGTASPSVVTITKTVETPAYETDIFDRSEAYTTGDKTVSFSYTKGRVLTCVPTIELDIPCAIDASSASFDISPQALIDNLGAPLYVVLGPSINIRVPYRVVVVEKLTNHASSGDHPRDFVNYAGELYFTMADHDGRRELFKTDGEAISKVIDIYTDSTDYISDLIVFGDDLYFAASANALSGMRKLFKYNATSNTVTQISNLANGNTDFFPTSWRPISAVVNGKLYIQMNSPASWSNEHKLFEVGPTNLTAITNFGGSEGESDQIHDITGNGTVGYFIGDKDWMTHLYRFDSAGTVRAVGTAGAQFQYPEDVWTHKGVTYFTADDGASIMKIFKIVGDQITRLDYFTGTNQARFVYSDDNYMYVLTRANDMANRMFRSLDGTTFTQITNYGSGNFDKFLGMLTCDSKTFAFILNSAGKTKLHLLDEAAKKFVQISDSHIANNDIDVTDELQYMGCLDGSLYYSGLDLYGNSRLYRVNVSQF